MVPTASAQVAATSTQVAPVLGALEDAWENRSRRLTNPSLADDADARAWYARYFRSSASPSLVQTLMRHNLEVDIRDLLPAIEFRRWFCTGLEGGRAPAAPVGN